MSGRPNVNGVMECPDGHRCENGSLCEENPYDEGNYYCDCDASVLDSRFRGLYCEHEATEYCSYKGAVSRNSFCTNGGKCVAKVGENEAHLGCDCPKDYEGEHCQFVAGTKPENWPTVPGSQSQQGGGGGGLGVGAIVGIVVAAVVVVLVGAVFLWRRNSGSGRSQEHVAEEVGSDLGVGGRSGKAPVTEHQLDPDGGKLQEVVDTSGDVENASEEGMVEEDSEII